MLAERQADRAGRTQARIAGLTDRIAGSLGIKLSPPEEAEVRPTGGQVLDSIAAAALNIVAVVHPAIAPNWSDLTDETARILSGSGWTECPSGEEALFRTISAAIRVDHETSYAVSSHPPAYKAVVDFYAHLQGQSGPFKDSEPWASQRFFLHPGAGARAMLAEKQVSPPIRTMILSADLGTADPRACRTTLGDARFDRLFRKTDFASDGFRLRLEATTPRDGRDGLSISLRARVRDEAWVERAADLGVPLGHCQIELIVEEAMY